MLRFLRSNWLPVLLILLLTVAGLLVVSNKQPATVTITNTDTFWHAPSLFLDPIKDKAERALVVYGAELIANTATYLGPNGSVATISNGMNCQNCHLDAGTKPWGNNFAGVFANYPKYRDRSGTYESVYKRVSDCFERSLNGSAPDSNSREFKAIHAYIRWLGKAVPKGTKPEGSGIVKLAYLHRAADPAKGKLIYATQCARCHGANGTGLANTQGNGYTYPPLWGEDSYNTGAGLYRLSNFAGYIKKNMPFKEVTVATEMSDEDAWDLAAFVNSQPRPIWVLDHDWPDISKKPFDYPFGPYSDHFTEQQHKFGPYLPILQAHSKQ